MRTIRKNSGWDFKMIQRIIEKADVKHPVDADKILKEIKNYDIVSFDIFDTLLKRNVKEPTDVFSYMEKKYQINGFREKRIEAEKAARKKKNGLEISLEDIYAEFGADYSDEEMETESGLEFQLYTNKTGDVVKPEMQGLTLQLGIT